MIVATPPLQGEYRCSIMTLATAPIRVWAFGQDSPMHSVSGARVEFTPTIPAVCLYIGKNDPLPLFYCPWCGGRLVGWKEDDGWHWGGCIKEQDDG